MVTAFTVSELLRRNQQGGNIRHQMVAQKNNIEVILKILVSLFRRTYAVSVCFKMNVFSFVKTKTK